MKEMIKLLILAAAVALMTGGCENKKGVFVETVQCSHPVDENVGHFEEILEKNGLSIFQVIDHAQNAKHADMSLEPTTLVVFGNPKLGTLLMQCNRSMGLDLPLRMLFYTDYDGNHWLSYTNPEYYTLKHNIKDKKCLEIVRKVNIALQTMAEEVADMESNATVETPTDRNQTEEQE